jgi:uncharacterized Zn finger protein
VTRLVCPHCGNYYEYEVVSLTNDEAVCKCHKCGRESRWERTLTSWRVREEAK